MPEYTPHPYGIERTTYRHGESLHKIPTDTGFFAHQSITGLAEVAAELPRNQQGEIAIANPACSTGQETWSLAAALAIRGLPFYIEATDVNPFVLECARQSYPVDRHDYHQLEQRRVLHFFTPSSAVSAFLKPCEQLTQQVQFAEHDLIRYPLPTQQYGAVLLNGFLHYFHGRSKLIDAIVQHAVAGLQPGGVLAVDRPTYVSRKLRRQHQLQNIDALAGRNEFALLQRPA